MALIDIGLNLTHPSLHSQREAVLERAHAAGVVQCILTGTSVEESRQALQTCEEFSGRFDLYATAGMHPHEARHWNSERERAIGELLQAPLVRAVGECGLDFFRDLTPRPQQEKALEAQLQLAVACGKPVFLHERDASERLIAILRDYRDQLSGAVVHCFTGAREALYAYLDLDLHIGITGWINDERRGEHLHPLMRDIPEGRLMLESDAPYLLPRTLRPRPKHGHNEPAFLVEVQRLVAELRQESPEALARHTSACARALFGLPEPAAAAER